MGPISKIANRLAVAIAAFAIASGAALLPAQAGNYSLWPAACPFGSHYVCWHEPLGGRYCGCRPGGDRPACPAGYYYTCRPDAFGNPYCACY